jgi:midasin (ATPase involved in ribosome maturation)
LGALKPVSQSKVEWVDGPLTKGIREGGTIVITALEAAGAELVEKLNMLTDDAKAITLPPESGETSPIHLKEDSRVYAFKMFRKTKSVPTISRAFRNRFTPVLFPSLEDEKSLKEILQFYLPDDTLSGLMTTFHTKIKTLSQKRVIGSGNLNPYLFGLSNLLKWKDHIVKYNSPDTLVETVVRGAKISYINQISDPKERFDMERLIDTAVKSKTFPDDLYQKIEDKKKTFTDPVNLDRNPWWDPELHKREANTGKAPLKNSIQASGEVS